MRYALGREALRDAARARQFVAIAAAVEIVLGVVLVVDPALAVRLFWAAALPSGGVPLGHLAGFSFLALGIACWPEPTGPSATAVRGLLVYNALAAAFFLYSAIRGEFVGVLLWPAILLHATFTVLLVRFLKFGKERP